MRFVRKSVCIIRRFNRAYSSKQYPTAVIANKLKFFNPRSPFFPQIHTGEKPYECRFCEKSFNQSSARNIHMRIHTRARDYICHICSAAFTQSASLKRHVKIHINSDTTNGIDTAITAQNVIEENVRFQIKNVFLVEILKTQVLTLNDNFSFINKSANFDFGLN